MKKILLTAGVACLSTVVSLKAQSFEVARQEKEDLKQQEKEIRQEEKNMRHEERAMKRTEVSYMTKRQFKIDFPQALNPDFYAGEYFEEVSFDQAGKRHTAFYDFHSTLVGVTTDEQFDDIPVKGRKEIEKKYLDKGYTVEKVILFDDNEANEADMWMYNQQFADVDNYFVELSKPGKTIVVQVNMEGWLYFFKNL